MSIFLRMVFWIFIYLLLLGFADIRVSYRDGLTIQLWGWGNYRKRRAALKEGEEDENG